MGHHSKKFHKFHNSGGPDALIIVIHDPVLIKQLDHHKVAQGANKGGWIDLGTRKWASFTSLSWTLRNCLGPWYPMFEQSPNPCSKDGSLAFRSKWMTKTWHCGRWRIHGWAARPIQLIRHRTPLPGTKWWSCHDGHGHDGHVMSQIEVP